MTRLLTREFRTAGRYVATETTTYQEKLWASAIPRRSFATSAGRAGVLADRDVTGITITGSLGDSFALRAPLFVRVWREQPDLYVATANGIATHAYGNTSAEAVSELRLEIAEYLEWLIEAGELLSPALRDDREALLRRVRRRDG